MEEMKASLELLEAMVERLELTAENLEQRMAAQDAAKSGCVEHMVAVDGMEFSASAGWEERLAAAERSIAELRAVVELHAAGQAVADPAAASVGQASPGRRTLPASTANLLAKHGVSDSGQLEQGALDAALHSLPVEQRIAVKSQLLRAGLLG